MKRTAVHHFAGRSDLGGGIGSTEYTEKTSEEDLRKAPNAERDLHRTFQRVGLSLPIPIRKLVHTLPDGQMVSIEYVQPSDWLSYLIKKTPELLAGGHSSLEDQLQGFWELYRYEHGTHAVFEQHANDLHHTFPLQFWGDEGRGPKRAGYMAGTIESCLGLDELELKELNSCDCGSRLKTFPSSWIPTCTTEIDPETSCMKSASRVATNYKGHSFLTRYLLFGIPGYLYASKNDMVRSHLEKVAQDLLMLFREGIVVNNQRYYAALVGSKGDLKFQAAVIAHMVRSYMNLGRVRAIACCSLCLAGTSDYPMEDVQHEPLWARSMFQSRPWNDDASAPFLEIPYDNTQPESAYKLDMFHVFKVGIGRDIVGSSLVWFCKLGMFDLDGESQALPARLTRCHSWFKLWAKANSRSPGLRSFTKSYFNAPTAASAPWTNSKGSDTMMLLEFLEWLITLHLRDPADYLKPHEPMLDLLKTVVKNSLEMCKAAYKHPLWVRRECAQLQYCNAMVVVRGYKRLAQYFLELGVAGFRLKPKLHALHHIAYSMKIVLQKPSPKVMNWVAYACEMNEDHIGHTARMSRKLATKTLGLRLMQRYFLKTRALMRRHFQKRKAKI